MINIVDKSSTISYNIIKDKDKERGYNDYEY